MSNFFWLQLLKCEDLLLFLLINEHGVWTGQNKQFDLTLDFSQFYRHFMD